jgi:ADP-sugar diphosphatase
MSSFNLPDVSPTVPVTFAPDLNLSKAQLLAFPAFKVWLKTLQSSLALQKKRDHSFHESPYALRSIHVQSVDFFGAKIGFMKFVAEVTNDNGEKLPGIVFLRGGSVAMLMILRPTDQKDERWVIMTAQPRIAAGSLSFYEIPAGMIDDSGTFAGAAAKEIKEETGLSIPQHELIDMTEMALKSAKSPEQHLQAAMYPSPGGCDEYIPLFLWERFVERQEIDELRGKLTGLRAQGEKITVQLVKYEELWREGARDAKTLAAWALYEGLKREGAIE